ncbi:MAG: hypothetical protein GXY53_11660, partial [Desulfobulbus sp.]|nr:hypothetical protein [Desulfobulbus sp.]
MTTRISSCIPGFGRYVPSSLWPIAAVLAIGLAVRLIALAQVTIINPDGIFYISQAKAIWSGQWDLVNLCQLSYVSLYPFLIALGYYIVPDWILSGQLVALVCSMGMLFILYQLVRLFFNEIVSSLTILLLAVTPIFVRYSVDVMRDALFWFLFSLALWLFVQHMRKKTGSGYVYWLLTGSSTAILLASWSRIEAIVLLPVSLLFLCVHWENGRLKRLLAFLMPVVCAGLFGLLVALISDRDIFALVRVDEIFRKFSEPFQSYKTLRLELKQLAGGYGFSLLGNYLESSYHTVWLTALGILVSNAGEAFFYPYLVFYIAGWKEGIHRVRSSPQYQYMFLLLACSFVVLFVHTQHYWVATYRFMTLLIFPSCVLAGLGVERIYGFLMRVCKLTGVKAGVLLALAIVAVSLSKNIQKIEDDKRVYVRIGSTIAS